MKYTDPDGFDPTCAFWCEAIISTALNFLFGGGDDAPPPPDWCKDNTAGCGGVSAASTNTYMPGAPTLPSTRARPCLFTCKGGGLFGVVFDFGGPGTGNPLILWATEDDSGGLLSGEAAIEAAAVEHSLTPSLWDRIYPFSVYNVLEWEKKIDRPCPPNCSTSVSADHAELYAQYTSVAFFNALGRFGFAASSTKNLPRLGIGSTTIQFGRVQNQINHTFRHTDAAGLARADVRSAIVKDLTQNGSSIRDGLNIRSLRVNGVDLTVNAYRLPDGTINVGRITTPR